jgi:HTH-type transcriptional regulator / antitoxin HipB
VIAQNERGQDSIDERPANRVLAKGAAGEESILCHIRHILLDKGREISIMCRIRYMNFAEAGKLIREARGKAGLTQADLAKRLGMSRATISRLESGTIQELGIRKYAQVADRLGLEVILRRKHTRMTLHEAYDRNREERTNAFKETDATLAQLRGRPLDD